MAGYFEYIKQHPVAEPPEQKTIKDTARTISEQQAIKDKVEDLKISIAEQLEQGNAPQYILYTAINAIALLTDDPDWEAVQEQVLDKVYDDLRQECIHIDTAAVAMHRLKKMRKDYNDRLKSHIERDLNTYKKINEELQKVLSAVDTIDDLEFWQEKRKMEPIERELAQSNK